MGYLRKNNTVLVISYEDNDYIDIGKVERNSFYSNEGFDFVIDDVYINSKHKSKIYYVGNPSDLYGYYFKLNPKQVKFWKKILNIT